MILKTTSTTVEKNINGNAMLPHVIIPKEKTIKHTNSNNGLMLMCKPRVSVYSPS